jgi:hypothetical protein
MTTAPSTDAIDVSADHTTDDETVIRADSTSQSITITVAQSDLQAGNILRVVDTGENASANSITIQTEGSAVFYPGAKSSVTISADGAFVKMWSDGIDWFTERTVEASDVIGSGVVDETNATSGLAAKKSVSRGVNGSVQFTPVGTETTTTTNTGTLITTTVQTVDRITFDDITVGIGAGSASVVQLARNGNEVANNTATIYTGGTVESSSVTWTASVGFGELPSTTNGSNTDRLYSTAGFGVTSSDSFADSTQIATSGSILSFSGITVYTEGANSTFYASLNGSSFYDGTGVDEFVYKYTGSFSSPSITLRVHLQTTTSQARFTAGTGDIKLISNSPATATLSVSQNEVVTVE